MKAYSIFLRSSKAIFDDHYGFKKKGKAMFKHANSEERPYSLTKSLKKKDKLSVQNPPGSLRATSNEYLNQGCDLPSKTLKNSCEKFPTIEKIRTSIKMPYVCPIISETSKACFPTYKTRRNFITSHDQTKKPKEAIAK